jgi:hypothetical protein
MLVEQLRDNLKPQGELRPLCLQAADEIERLRAIIAWLDDNEPTMMSMVRERLAHLP